MYTQAPVTLPTNNTPLIGKMYGYGNNGILFFILVVSFIIILSLIIEGFKNGYIKRMIMVEKEEDKVDVDFNNRFKKYKKKSAIALVAIIVINVLAYKVINYLF